MAQQDRMTIEEVGKAPAVMMAKEAARLMGRTQREVTTLLARGKLPGTKVGKYWHVNTAALLKRLGY